MIVNISLVKPVQCLWVSTTWRNFCLHQSGRKRRQSVSPLQQQQKIFLSLSALSLRGKSGLSGGKGSGSTFHKHKTSVDFRPRTGQRSTAQEIAKISRNRNIQIPNQHVNASTQPQTLALRRKFRPLCFWKDTGEAWVHFSSRSEKIWNSSVGGKFADVLLQNSNDKVRMIVWWWQLWLLSQWGSGGSGNSSEGRDSGDWDSGRQWW